MAMVSLSGVLCINSYPDFVCATLWITAGTSGVSRAGYGFADSAQKIVSKSTFFKTLHWRVRFRVSTLKPWYFRPLHAAGHQGYPLKLCASLWISMFKSRQTRTSIGLARGAVKNINLTAWMAQGDA
ncbi:hypothetical protein [Rhodoferax sp.]|uniref:hypothetical protein n=1 Tax=Rhodoferax sp. TaxID=50421 RepID=UPI0025DB32B1|nr:hypothetical protein [Rhodoferax sp.]MCM2341589.1 hypothetical protein [Rhodoferax sp.]